MARIQLALVSLLHKKLSTLSYKNCSQSRYMFNDILDVQYHIVQVYLLSLKRRLCFTDVCLSVCLSTGLLNKKLG